MKFFRLTLPRKLLLISATVVVSASALIGQTVADTAVSEEEKLNDSTILGTFKQGGMAMYPLLAFSIGTVGLVIYNSISVREKSIINMKVLQDEVGPALDQLDFQEALNVCERHDGPLLKILQNGLETTHSGKFESQVIDQAFDEAASVELAKPFVFINYLQVIASVAPMVGLLGTVSGMVKAFRTIAEQGMGRPELLADNISEALITTASGLIVAIPALIAYFYFKNKYGKIASQVSQILGRTLRSVSYRMAAQDNIVA